MTIETVKSGEEYTKALKFFLNDLSTVDANGNAAQAAIDFGVQGYAGDAQLNTAGASQSMVRIWITDQTTKQPVTFQVSGAPMVISGVFMRRLTAQSTMAYIQTLATAPPGTYDCKAIAEMLNGDNKCEIEWILRIIP